MAEQPIQNKNDNEITTESAVAKLQDICSLHHDQAHPDKVDAAIRANVRISGTNFWVLIFAIAIASIGLNVNSTAVIIGAMLISPLMGPIVGIGYGAAVSDAALIRLAMRNMLVFVCISLFTATLYFLITPLQQAQSELLARTQPTLWDVLIAFFGGSAGIVAITRKEISNVIPGVAIATALMPPLCTAGYGLAHGNWDYFFGAFYLFAINCVFIAFATLLFSKILNLPRRGLVTDSKRRLHRIIIFVVVLAVMIPSGYLATNMVRRELFNTTVASVIKKTQQREGFWVLRSSIDDKQQSVNLVINGIGDTARINHLLTEKLQDAGISNPQVKVLYAGGNEASLDLMKHEVDNNQINALQLQDQLKQQQEYINQLLSGNINNPQDEAVIQEIQAQYPEALKIAVGKGMVWFKTANDNSFVDDASAVIASDANTASDVISASVAAAPIVKNETNEGKIVWMVLPEALNDKEHQRIHAWLIQRFKGIPVELIISVSQPQSPHEPTRRPIQKR